jgi:hypothetical protein
MFVAVRPVTVFGAIVSEVCDNVVTVILGLPVA